MNWIKYYSEFTMISGIFIVVALVELKSWIKSYEEFMITLGVFVLIVLMFYVKIVKGSKGEIIIKKFINWIRRKRKDKQDGKVKPDSDIEHILNAIGEHYEIIDYAVQIKKGTIRITIKRK